MAFWGSPCIHGICATSAKKFSAADTLGWGDIKLDKVEVEEMKHQHSIQFVEIVETRDWMCPIGAYKALVDSLGRSNLTPFCETADSSLVMGKWINKLLKTFLGGHACYLGGKLSSYSFREGLATALERAVVK